MPHANSVNLDGVDGNLPCPIYFRLVSGPAEQDYSRHHHAWSEAAYAYCGTMKVDVMGQVLLAPPRCLVWLPSQVEHRWLNSQNSNHCSLYIAQELSREMPDVPCVLEMNPLLRALLDDLCQQPKAVLPYTPALQRVLRVIVDQLNLADIVGNYLPNSDDEVLGPILRALEANPADVRTMAEWASLSHMSERTLMRRCQSVLGIPLAEWRQRRRIVTAISLLDSSHTIESLSRNLGYGSASAFIAMFRRSTGVTPMDYRRRIRRIT